MKVLYQEGIFFFFSTSSLPSQQPEAPTKQACAISDYSIFTAPFYLSSSAATHTYCTSLIRLKALMEINGINENKDKLGRMAGQGLPQSGDCDLEREVVSGF